MCLISKFIDLLVLRIASTTCVLLFCSVYGFYCLMAYVKQEYPIYLISILIWSSMLTYWAFKVASITVFSFSVSFFVNFYLNLRFRQLFSSVKSKISIDMNILIRRNNKLSQMTHQSNEFFKLIMAISYFIASMTAVLTYIIFFYGRGIFLFRLAVLIVGSFGCVLIYLLTRFSAILSLEAHRFYVPINSFICATNLRLSHKWKVSYNLLATSGRHSDFKTDHIFNIP